MHADWEWDLETPSGNVFVVEMPCYMRPTSWGLEWNWEEQSKRRRARALSRLDSELAFLAEHSMEQYLADAEAFTEIQVVAAGGGQVWAMV